MSETDVNVLLVRLASFEATIATKLDGLAADNVRGESVHVDHETRIRALEAAANQSRGVWKLLTAGGLVGATIAGLGAIALRALGA